MNSRIIELAIETLEKKRAAIANEIAELTTQLTGGVQAEQLTPVVLPAGRKIKSAAERKAHSARMKEIWAARKAKAGKAKAPRVAAGKAQKISAANKARSEKMKASWAARKAAKAKK